MQPEDIYNELIIRNIEFKIPDYGDGDLEIKYPNGIKLRYHTKRITPDVMSVITSYNEELTKKASEFLTLHVVYSMYTLQHPHYADSSRQILGVFHTVLFPAHGNTATFSTTTLSYEEAIRETLKKINLHKDWTRRWEEAYGYIKGKSNKFINNK